MIVAMAVITIFVTVIMSTAVIMSVSTVARLVFC